MRKTKYYTSGLLIVFLLLYILSAVQIALSSTDQYNLNLNVDDNTESWSRLIKSGPQLYRSSMKLIDNYTYIIGSIGEYHTSDDIYLAKFNSLGVKLWEQTWGGSEYDYLKGYIVDSENNIYIVGFTSSSYFGISGSIFLLKYNTTGDLIWSKTIDPFSGNPYYDIHSIQIDLNDSIYISCTLNSPTNKKTFITKLNSSGNILWTQEIELSSQSYNLITQIDSVGNLYLYGGSFLLKLNSSGSKQWDYEWEELQYGYQMKLDLDDNIIIMCESSNSEISKYELCIMKINNSGNLTKKVVCASYVGWPWPKIEGWFLDNIFILVGSSLLKYNYSLDNEWNFTVGNHVRIEDCRNFNFGTNSQHEMYFIYLNNGGIYILRFNNSGTIISHFKWGGSYNDYLHTISIDSQDDLYVLCNIHYVNIWKEGIDLSILVKNPKSDGKAPWLEHLIDDRDIFIFSLLGVMCFISVTLVYKTLKPKLR